MIELSEGQINVLVRAEIEYIDEISQEYFLTSANLATYVQRLEESLNNLKKILDERNLMGTNVK